MNPYVFIVGCPRSGTTLLRRMVDAHPEVAIPSAEQHWIVNCYRKRVGMTTDGFVAPALADKLLADRRFAKLGIDRETVLAVINSAAPLPYSRFVTTVFDLYAAAHGKTHAGDKSPGFARSIPILHELWPEARFVHLIRDGRDVWLSVAKWPRAAKLAQRFPSWSAEPVVSTALWWEWHVRLGRDAGRQLGPELYHEVRYETLVAEPARTLKALCNFLGLPYLDAMLRFHEGKLRSDTALDAKKAWLPPTPGLRDWRIQMAPEDLERFEAVVGGLLDELGYARAAP